MIDVKEILAKMFVLFELLPEKEKEEFNAMIQKTSDLKHLADNVNAWYLSFKRGDI